MWEEQVIVIYTCRRTSIFVFDDGWEFYLLFVKIEDGTSLTIVIIKVSFINNVGKRPLYHCTKQLKNVYGSL